MLVRRLIAPVVGLLVTVVVPGCGHEGSVLSIDLSGLSADPLAEELDGDWSGELSQEGLPDFRVAVRFTPGKPTVVAYTGIDCGGTWRGTGTLLSQPPIYLVKERIVEGAGDTCKGSGSVSLTPDEPCRAAEPQACSSYKALEYEFRGGGAVSKGVLTRVSADELDQVFEQAGLDPPD